MGNWVLLDDCTKKVLRSIETDDVFLPDPTNTLKQWKIKENQLGFESFPEVAINNMIYRGNF